MQVAKQTQLTREPIQEALKNLTDQGLQFERKGYPLPSPWWEGREGRGMHTLNLSCLSAPFQQEVGWESASWRQRYAQFEPVPTWAAYQLLSRLDERVQAGGREGRGMTCLHLSCLPAPFQVGWESVSWWEGREGRGMTCPHLSCPPAPLPLPAGGWMRECKLRH